jgi:ribonucleoside-diphosphate reductase alpha chain
MRRLETRDSETLNTWAKVLKSRMETGEPYIMYKDNVNKQNPMAYMLNNLDVTMTNICSEITLFTDEEHSFICCLSSLNLAKYEEWKDTDTVEMATWFLDGVMQEFIEKSNGIDSLTRTNAHARKGRALGLGVMGWHTFLQQKGLPFNSIASTAHTHNIFSDIRNKAEKASRDMAVEYGEPLWCRGTGMRNTHLLAIAPTVSNSVITGGISAGIEPLPANIYTFNGAKGTFIRKNKVLEALLESKGYNKDEYWDQMLRDNGSVVGLSDNILSPDEKELFLTFPEINQLELVRQAAIRQRYIDQTQSLNLSFDVNDSPKWINQVHIEAWKLGVKTLYYLRTDSVIKGDLGSRQADCVSCDG